MKDCRAGLGSEGLPGGAGRRRTARLGWAVKDCRAGLGGEGLLDWAGQ